MTFYSFLSVLEEDEESFVCSLYKEYEKTIYAIAFNIIHNNHDAEDIVNEVMMKVISHVTKFIGRSGNEITSQIVIYSKNTAIDFYRKNKRRTGNESELVYSNEDDEEETIDIPDSDGNIDNIVLSKETAAIIREAMSKLSDEHSDVIKLRLIYGYSNAETASILGISENAVSLRLHKAKKKIIELAGGELYERYQSK